MAAEAAGLTRECPNCGPLPASEFYAGCSECKSCKRQRSKDHRAVQARKLAIAERLVDVLADLARGTSNDIDRLAGSHPRGQQRHDGPERLICGHQRPRICGC